MTTNYFIGLMSGTSLDGVDAVLCAFDSKAKPLIWQAKEHIALPFSNELRAQLLLLNQANGKNELHRAALLSNELARCYAQSVHLLLDKAQFPASQIQAIGVHGQTVRHQPHLYDGIGYSIQLNNPSLLAELTQIPVIADFRSRDIAAGGEGAPLVPAFHAEVFAKPNETTAVLNIGGISNLTILGASTQVNTRVSGTFEGDLDHDKNSNLPTKIIGFDCGAGNALIDDWCFQHTKQMFDQNGAWAATGKINNDLLNDLCTEPFLHQAPPKSTGRDLFNPAWFQEKLQAFLARQSPSLAMNPADIQATLTAFTAQTCVDALYRFSKWKPNRLLVCGGGALNEELMRQLRLRLSVYFPLMEVQSSEKAGLPPLQVEAVAFAWLARQTWLKQTSNLPEVTGAKGARILGAVYWA